MKTVGKYSSDIIAEAILELEVAKDVKASHRNAILSVTLEDGWIRQR